MFTWFVTAQICHSLKGILVTQQREKPCDERWAVFKMKQSTSNIINITALTSMVLVMLHIKITVKLNESSLAVLG